ncbi:ankyrin repeat-containing domain protein [Mycena epipterygia]|nr:ankyrin repeat-containing domain protein [Mycena epipterygia]
MADIVGLVASILQLVDTVVKTRDYIQDFRNAPKDQKRLLLEIRNVEPLVRELDKRIKNNHVAGLTSGLEEFREPLIQLKGTMEQLVKKLDLDGIRKVSSRLTWSLWGKDDVQEGLNTMERFKSLLNVWLDMDIWNSTLDIASTLNDVTEKQQINHGVVTTSIQKLGREQKGYHRDVAKKQQINHGVVTTSIKELGREQKEYHRDTILALKDASEEQSTNHNYLSKSVRSITRKQEAVTREEIIDWYSPLNFFPRQADIFGTHQPGTGKWFLEHHSFEEWKSGTGGILWCSGMPGAGKTVLLSIAVHHLRSDRDREIGVAAIYLNHKESDAHSPSKLLQSLWRQLVHRKPISSVVQELYDEHYEPRTRPSINDDHAVLRSIIAEYSKVFILVDALDEYPETERHVLLRYLSALRPGVNLMLTSRPHIEIDHVISQFTTLEIRATGDDIREYLSGKIHECSHLSTHIRKCPDLQDAIEKQIVERSDGMFLLAKLHIDSLTTKLTIKAVRETLRSMPNDLEHTYDEVVHRINRQGDDHRNLAWLALSWITHAKRLLRPAELVEALAVELGATYLDPENLLDMKTIQSSCAGLIIINEKDDTIRLIHYTMQHYLERIQSSEFSGASIHITMICITYLSFEVFIRNVHNDDPKKLLHENPFLNYAVEYCLIHVRGEPESQLRDTILSFLGNCSPWRELWNQRKTLPLSPSRLWIAAAFHLHYISRYLIQEDGAGEVLEEATSKGRTDIVRVLVANGDDIVNHTEYNRALQAACMHGREDIICLLLDHGADVNVQGRYGTLLQIAWARGRTGIIGILLEHGADINANIRWQALVLEKASRAGNEAMIRLLIKHGADINSNSGGALEAASRAGHEVIFKLLIEQGAHVGSASARWQALVLEKASTVGDEAMIRLLIKHGADINSNSGGALEAASRAGNEAIFKLLIEHGADIGKANASWQASQLEKASKVGDEARVRLLINHGADIHTNSGGALKAALSTGHEVIFKLLIEGGADVNANGGDALRTASQDGHQVIVRLLINHGADIHANSGGALKAALSAGHEAIFKLLIEHGADVNANNGDALRTASEAGNEAIVGLLIESGADVNANGGDALRAASQAGNEVIVRLLIERGADVNANGGDALRAASQAGNEVIVRLLIERGADINANRGDALRMASKAGNEVIVRLLIKRGANINANRGDALRAAVWGGHRAIVRLLIEHGADVNANGGDALRAASRCGHQAIVRLLIEHGADVNAKRSIALRAASEAGNEAIVRLLIEGGANVNANGGDALRAASPDGNEAISTAQAISPYR